MKSSLIPISTSVGVILFILGHQVCESSNSDLLKARVKSRDEKYDFMRVNIFQEELSSCPDYYVCKSYLRFTIECES